MDAGAARLILAAGIGQLCVLIASAMVSFRLNWRASRVAYRGCTDRCIGVTAGYVVMS
jgi:hypothetical protein